MTRSSPHYDDDELVPQSAEEGKTNTKLDQKSIIAAVSIILREQAEKNDAAIAEMQTSIAALQASVEALEADLVELSGAKRLRTVSA